MGLGRDRVPGRSEPALQGPASAPYTEGQHIGVLRVGGDVVWLGAWLRGAGPGQGQRAAGRQEGFQARRWQLGSRVAGRVERGDRFRSAVEVEA